VKTDFTILVDRIASSASGGIAMTLSVLHFACLRFRRAKSALLLGEFYQ